MSTEDKKDLRLAIVVSLVILGIGIFIGKCWACDSYEDCMNPKTYTPTKSAVVFNKKEGEILIPKKDQPDYLKAIAYKLDEISKKLDKNEN